MIHEHTMHLVAWSLLLHHTYCVTSRILLLPGSVFVQLFHLVCLSVGQTEEPQPAVAAAVCTTSYARLNCIHS